MKKILPVVVLFAMLFNTAGYYIVYEFNRYIVRREISGLIEHGCFTKELSVLTIFNPSADPAFRRIEDHEIQYHGNMYDVSKEVHKGKTVVFYCIHDKKEQRLISGMKNTHHQKKAQNLLHHLVTTALPVIPERTHPPTAKKIIYPLLSEHFAGLPQVPLQLPPETA